MPHRLFIAVDLPEPVRRRLARLMADAPRGVRPVRPEQTHLTLHFLGDVEDEALASLATGLGRMIRPPFTIDLSGTGVFPPRGRPAVLWAGVAASDELVGLHAAVADVLAGCGFAPEARPWVPHVTLARLGPGVPRGWTADFLARHHALAAPGLPVTAVRLYESTREPSGSVHAAVATVELGTGRGGAEA